MACSKTAFIEFKDCESSYLFEVGLTPNTSYFYEITDKFGNVYQKAFTTDGDGYFSISPNDFPPYLFTNAGGNFTLIVKESLTDCGVVYFDYCEDTFDTIVFSFIKNADNSNATVVDKCKKVYDCLGISDIGSESKFLNERGVFETPIGGGFSQVQADWNQTDNTEVDFIKNKPSIPSINGLATENYVDTEVSSAISSANGYTDSVASSKVDKVTGKGLSENDYITADKNKLDGIQSGAEVNVNADWNATSGDAEILNKPTIPDTSTFALKSEVATVLFKSITQTIITGKTVETSIYSIPLPTDGFNYAVSIYSQAQVFMFGGAAISHRLRIGTYSSPIDGATGANAIGNQTLIATNTASSSIQIPITRRPILKGGISGSIYGVLASYPVANDANSTGTFLSIATKDFTTQHYLYVTFNPSVVGAIIHHNQIYITLIKV